MILLYCNIANAVVVGIHDDQQGPVAMSAYGAAGTIRIVPWAQPLGNLTKAGAAPPAGMPDTRPYAQPTETPAILLKYAAQVRFNVSVEGISFKTAGNVTIPVATDRTSQMLLTGLAQYAATLAPSASLTFTQNGVAYQMTAQDAINMNNAVTAHIQNGRNLEASAIADQNATTPSMRVYADIDAHFAGAMRKPEEPAPVPSSSPSPPPSRPVRKR